MPSRSVRAAACLVSILACLGQYSVAPDQADVQGSRPSASTGHLAGDRGALKHSGHDEWIIACKICALIVQLVFVLQKC